jgi:hypothetical protein
LGDNLHLVILNDPEVKGYTDTSASYL